MNLLKKLPDGKAVILVNNAHIVNIDPNAFPARKPRFFGRIFKGFRKAKISHDEHRLAVNENTKRLIAENPDIPVIVTDYRMPGAGYDDFEFFDRGILKACNGREKRVLADTHDGFEGTLLAEELKKLNASYIINCGNGVKTVETAVNAHGYTVITAPEITYFFNRMNTAVLRLKDIDRELKKNR